MTGERVFTVKDTKAYPCSEITLADAGFTERGHLQEWVIAHPEMLGDDVMVVSFELARWINAAGDRELDRLDVLGLDTAGQLVVAELKRGEAPYTAEMQAIKYAALASQFTVSTLAEAFAKYLSTGEPSINPDGALDRLLEHAPEMTDDTLRLPRIVLMASSFPPVLTNTAVYLRRVGLDLSLVTFQAYRTLGEEVVLTVSQLYPLQEMDELMVVPGSIQQRKIVAEKKREARTTTRLFDSGAIADGTSFVLKPPSKGENVDRLLEWIAEDPERGRVTWQNSRSRPLLWNVDHKAYSATGLVSLLFQQATGLDLQGIQGPIWWVDSHGKNLWQLADELP
jgi:hypothetical protein